MGTVETIRKLRSFKRYRIKPSLNRVEAEKLRPLLTEKFGKPPSDADVTWAYLNHKSLDCVKQRQWGEYRNTRLDMAAVLDGEKKLEAALRHYLEVCFLDLNGARNRGLIITNGNPSLGSDPDFMVESAFLAPAVMSRIAEIILILKLDEGKVREDFMCFVEHEMRGLVPVSSEKAWEKLSSELYM